MVEFWRDLGENHDSLLFCRGLIGTADRLDHHCRLVRTWIGTADAMTGAAGGLGPNPASALPMDLTGTVDSTNQHYRCQ